PCRCAASPPPADAATGAILRGPGVLPPARAHCCYLCQPEHFPYKAPVSRVTYPTRTPAYCCDRTRTARLHPTGGTGHRVLSGTQNLLVVFPGIHKSDSSGIAGLLLKV